MVGIAYTDMPFWACACNSRLYLLCPVQGQEPRLGLSSSSHGLAVDHIFARCEQGQNGCHTGPKSRLLVNQRSPVRISGIRELAPGHKSHKVGCLDRVEHRLGDPEVTLRNGQYSPTRDIKFVHN